MGFYLALPLYYNNFGGFCQVLGPNQYKSTDFIIKITDIWMFYKKNWEILEILYKNQ